MGVRDICSSRLTLHVGMDTSFSLVAEAGAARQLRDNTQEDSEITLKQQGLRLLS